MQLLNKISHAAGLPRSGASWLGLLLAVVLLAGCKKGDGINDSIPAPAAVNRLAFFTDTVTVRTSTVLIDSIISSNNSGLAVGRYVDPLFGTVTGRGYFSLTLDSPLAVDQTQVYDSLALDIMSDNYRYGDSTVVQRVEVHQLPNALRTDGKFYYTKDDVPYNATVLGQRRFRPGNKVKKLHIRMSDVLGQALWNAGQTNQLTQQAQLGRYLNGLALTPGASDNGAILRFGAAGVLRLYHHTANDPATVLTYTFTGGGSATPHFYHLETNRTGTALAGLTNFRQSLSSMATGNRSFLQSTLGVYTRLEFPYLRSLNQFGSSLVLNSATLQLAVPGAAPNNAIARLPVIGTALTNRSNQLRAPYSSNPGAMSPATVIPAVITSPQTNLPQATYTINLFSYVQAVLAGTIENNGLLLSPDVTDRELMFEGTALGNQANTAAPLQFRIYYTRIVE
ncbi:DUF4270 family protein [Hymenobacter coccineus]|uniref:DUF4270 domain-containing protein n=1 Tax=Hymenobacter coccineus TaxID=1908235 RepID=A0A1G1TMY9_9BACT|nr:DUF4270 family protein [Hymenobacter coccineus]OGX92238.1 hypothetical protein BEN49_16725 [Hymenobacter coccineus]